MELKLKNFQAHERMVIKLSPTITTIVGPTDQGKSAILRALQFLALNNLRGEGFIREGSEEAKVALTIEDHVIERTRGPENLYALDGQEFKAFGSNVPDPISKILELSPINFQNQHDAPFWFALSAPEVSRQLNAVIDLSIIDSSLSNIAATCRSAIERKNVCEERLAKAEDSLSLLKPQRARISDFKELKTYHDNHRETDQAVSGLAQIVERIDSNQARKLESKAEDLAALLSAANVVREQSSRIETLALVIRSVEEKRAAAQAPPVFDSIENAHIVWKDYEGRMEQLEGLIQRIDKSLRATDILEESVKASERKFHEQTKGKQCPLCGNTI